MREKTHSSPNTYEVQPEQLVSGVLSSPFFSVVGALKSNKSLQELDLTSNRLNSYQDALHLGDMLRYNNTLVTLSLNSNSIADDGRIVSESEFALHD